VIVARRACDNRAMRAARLRAGVIRRLDHARHRGHRVRCPLCGHGFDRFKDDWNRPDALCWRCGAHERHRAQWLLLTEPPSLLADTSRLLHFAPEYCVRRGLTEMAARHGFEYVTADLDPTSVDLRLDLTQIDLPDASFDAVICSHVLEHVGDDGAAMRELRRITRRGGWCLVMVPLDLSRQRTYEDPAILSKEARLHAFWQPDHVRLYAPDIEQRLRHAGFDVSVIRPADHFDAYTVARARLLASDWLFLCR
jgi:SAM-dependent methyltransferase